MISLFQRTPFVLASVLASITTCPPFVLAYVFAMIVVVIMSMSATMFAI